MDEKAEHADSSSFSQIYVLTVLVSEARDLRAADLNGKSDPYVKVNVVNNQGGEMGAFETAIIKKNNKDPKWNKTHAFIFFDKPGKIVFEIWDHDEGALNGKDDELGTFTLGIDDINLFPLSQNTQNKVSDIHNDYQIKDKWYHLVHTNTKKDGRKDSKAGKATKGELKISLKGERLFPYETEKRLKNMVHEMESVKDEKQKQEKMLNDKINDLNTQMNKLNEQLKETESKLNDKKEECTQLTGQVEKLNGELKETQSKLNSEKEECQKLTNQISQLNVQIQEKETTLKSKKDEIVRLNEEIGGYKEEISKTKEAWNTAQAKCKEISSKYDKLTSDIDDLKEANGQQAKEAEKSQNQQNVRINTLQEEVNTKNNQIKDLRDRVRELEQEVALKQSTIEAGQDDAKQSLLKNGNKGKESQNCCIVM